MTRRSSIQQSRTWKHPSSTSNREGKQCSTGVSCEQLSSKGREQLVTCLKGGVFGVPEQLSACPKGLELPSKPNMFSGCGFGQHLIGF
eukprot:1403422-Amphidinium_carterae.1